MTHRYRHNIPSRMAKTDFVAVFGGVYEHSAWMAEEVWAMAPRSGSAPDRDTADGLHAAFQAVLDHAGYDAKHTLLCAHPDLVGKLAIADKLTTESSSEQASANLGNCTPTEFDAFQTLNKDYKEKFGFPFILAVRGYHRTEILEIFRQRMDNDRETEFGIALEQVHRIALLRLKDIT
ncbi:MAG: OHCU decarboxylase [Rhodospirillaceae bacterium TMED167]|nr:OHCU decarboxylase [Rhodospirillaceae bacterium]OUW31455.1 MAG: OHCU decarboxylase [Rhodospirillaceae bacterium TMED167]